MLIRWLWTERSWSAFLARAAMLPLAMLYRSIMTARASAYALGILPTHRSPLPTVAVGNLTVGGSGKTPVAGWIAKQYARRGIRPAILLRGYGGDEGLVHRRTVPEAVVIEHPNRSRSACEAARLGAQVAVLDDAFQRLSVSRDLNLALVSAESAFSVRWSFPAGPWRESQAALRRADIVIVTRKSVSRAAVSALVPELRRFAPGAPIVTAKLAIGRFEGLRSGTMVHPASLRDAHIVASAGVADPDTFAAQLRRYARSVTLLRWRNHQRYRKSHVRRLLLAGQSGDYVVVTEKDAVKLRSVWPRTAPEPLVAQLEVLIETNASVLHAALAAIPSGTTLTPCQEAPGDEPQRARRGVTP